MASYLLSATELDFESRGAISKRLSKWLSFAPETFEGLNVDDPIASEAVMKELQTILNALHKARDIVGQYAMPGDRDAESAMHELLGVLDSEELGCALERVEARLGSPSITPEVDEPESAV